MQPVVLTEGLTKRFGRTKAVMDLDLVIEQGEFVGIVGRPDSGKSTIHHLLLDLVHPSGGRARVLGFDTVNASYQVRREVGWVPAQVVPPPRITIEEWLDRARSFKRSDIDRTLRQRIIPLLDAALGDDLDELSQPELAIVAMVAAMQRRPQLLLLDEPIIQMRAQHELFLTMLDEYRSLGGTVLMTSRDLSTTGELVDRVGLLDSGTLVAEGTIAELRERGRQRLEFVFRSEQREDLFAAGPPAVIGAVVQGNVARVLIQGGTDSVVEYARQNGATEVIIHEAGVEELIADLKQLGMAS